MKICSILSLLLLANQAFSQAVTIDAKSSNPNIIQADSPSQAIQLPRVAGTSSITSPQAGQVMFNSSTSSPNFYNGTAWQNMGALPSCTFPKSVSFGGSCCGEDNEPLTNVTNWSWVVPAGITKIWVEMWAGGADGTKFNGNPVYFRGGNSGGYFSLIINVTPDSTITIKTGNGGAGQNSAHNAYPGGTTSILFGATVITRVASDYAALFTPDNQGYLAYYEGRAGKFGKLEYQTIYNGSTPQTVVWFYGGDGGASYLSQGGEGELVQTDLNFLTININNNNGNGGNGMFPGGGGGAGGIQGGSGANGVVVIHY
jgi:hypothetical protein